MTANFVYHDVHSNFHHQCLKIDNLFLYNIGCHGCQRGKSAAISRLSGFSPDNQTDNRLDNRSDNGLLFLL